MHKILDGKVKAIRNSYRNGTYVLEYEGDKIQMNGGAPFSILKEAGHEGYQQVTLKINEGGKVNDVLQYMLPLASINKLEEVVPTMNEIFIQKVGSSNA